MPENWKAYFLLYILWTVNISDGLSQNNIIFEHINRDNGLPNNSVTAIVQDKHGMMWFAMFNGLVRFNGYDYKYFFNNPKDSNSIADNYVNCLEMAQDGSLLIGHENHGFSIFNHQTESFRKFQHKPSDTNSLNSNHVFSLHGDKKGHVWIGTDKGLNRLDVSTGKFIHYPIVPEHKKNEAFISSILEENDGKLLLFVSGEKIIRFDPESGLSKLIYSISFPINQKRINKGGIIYKDHQDFLWIGAEFDGLSRFQESTGLIKHYNSKNSSIQSNVIMHIMEDHLHRIWVATDGGGLLNYNKEKDDFSAYRYDVKNKSSISSNAVYTVFEDDNSNIWIGTYSAGLNVIKPNKRRFETYTNNGNGSNSLSYKSVLSFADAGMGNVWVGTDGGGLNLFDPEIKKFEYFTKENTGICSNIVKSLARDSAGNIWIGTYADGLCVSNFQKNQFKSYRPSAEISSSTITKLNVWAITKGRNGDIWIGNLDGGLDQFVSSKNQFNHYLHDIKSGVLQNSGVVAILRDKQENIWLGLESQPGLHKLNPSTGIITSFIHQENNKNSLPNTCVQTIMQDSDGKIWVGLKHGGISMLENEKEKKFINYSQARGIPGTTTYGIVEDGHKNLWISTDYGIYVFERNKNSFRSFDKSDGLQSLEFAMNAYYKDKDGFIYFGGSDGFNRFHPDSIHYNKHVPNVLISSLKIFNQEIIPGKEQNGKIYFNKPIYLLDTLFLDHLDNVFTLEFTAVDYASPEKNKFAYRLEGLEENWNNVNSSKRITTYTNLSPGTYIFHVKACNNDGLWNEDGRRLTIIVSPPWWQTLWFKALLLALSLLVAYVYSYLRNKNIILSALVLKREVNLRTSELLEANTLLTEQKQEMVRQYDRILEQQKELLVKKTELEEANIFLETSNNQKSTLISVVSHDVKGPVNNFLTLIQSGQKVANEEVRAILNIAANQAHSLVQMTTDLLQWAMFQRNKSNQSKESVKVADLCNELREELNPFAFEKLVKIEVDVLANLYVLVDRNALKTIIRNICSNAIKFSPFDGTVYLHAREASSENGVLITVRDQGNGIEPDKIPDLFKLKANKGTKGTFGEQGEGIALVFADELAKLNNGRLSVESKLGTGSIFSILMPSGNHLQNLPQFELEQELPAVNSIEISREQQEHYKRILQRKIVILVEDDEILRKYLQTFLCEIVEVYDFSSGEDALLQIQSLSPDLIISDLNLKGMSGFDLIKIIKSDPQTSHISCFIISGEDRTETMARGYEYGIDSYLTKPLDKLELMDRISKHFLQQQQRVKRYFLEADTDVGILTDDPLNKIFLEKLVQFIENKLSDTSLNAQILCDEMGMSRSALYQKLKILTGQSVNDFIKVVRLRKSLELLKGRSFNISQIAYETGFNTPSYYTASFRKHFGFSPSEFLKRK